MTIEEIRELIQLVNETGVAELEVQRGDNRVRIRSGYADRIEVTAPPPGVPAPARPAKPTQHVASAPGPKEDPNEVLVRSPIVGTFYESPSPGSAPFVKPGDQVAPGKVLCIIESMKLMNEIEAEVAGVVVRRVVDNGQPVEYGEALFAIRPL